MRVREEEGEDRGGGEGKRRTWSLGRRLELGADEKGRQEEVEVGGGGDDREKGRVWMEELIIPN